MRALFIGSYPNDVEPYRSVFFRQLIHGFADMGVECHVISCVSYTLYRGRSGDIPKFRTETTPSGATVKVYYPHIVTYSAKKIGSWNTIHLTQAAIEQAVIKQVKKIGLDFDFVYGHFFIGGGLTAAKVGRRFGIPAYIAYGECNFDTEVRNKIGDITKKHMEGVRGIISVSGANCAELERRGFAEDIPVLLSVNSVNNSVFYPKDKLECRRKLGIDPDDFIVGFVGYFIERKGPHRLLDACRNIEGVKLAFAGRGENAPKGENVVFCRSLLHEEVADFLGAVDVFALPTLNEGCCNAVVEAMACGKAIISSDLPFNHDVLNSENSILVDPRNIGEIESAVRLLYSDPELSARLSENALRDARELTIPIRARNILNFIEKTCGAKNKDVENKEISAESH